MKKLFTTCTILNPAVAALLLTAQLGAAGQAGNSGPRVARNEILLSDAAWKLKSFAMGAGEGEKAFAPGFDESGFKTVPVPAEIQLTTGAPGNGSLSPIERDFADQQERVVVSQEFCFSQGAGRERECDWSLSGQTTLPRCG